MAGALLFGLFLGVVLLGGEFSINRFIDSVNTDDPPLVVHTFGR